MDSSNIGTFELRNSGNLYQFRALKISINEITLKIQKQIVKFKEKIVQIKGQLSYWELMQEKFNVDQKKRIKEDSQFIFMEQNVMHNGTRADKNWEECWVVCLSDKIIIYCIQTEKIIFEDFTLNTELFYNLGMENFGEFWIVNSKQACYFRVAPLRIDLITKQIFKAIAHFQEKNYIEKKEIPSIKTNNFERNKQIEELIISEQTYIQDLNLIIQFVIPQIELKFSKNEVQKIFINLPEVVQANQQFLNILLAQTSNKEAQYQKQQNLDSKNNVIEYSSNFFHAFQSFNIVSKFSCYIEFHRKYQEALECIAKCESNQIYLCAIKEAALNVQLAKYQSCILELEENNKQYQKIIASQQENNGLIETNNLVDFQKNHKQFANIIQAANQQNKFSGSLDDLIHKPIQRLPRLELLFFNLKNNSGDFPDFENLSDLLLQFKDCQVYMEQLKTKIQCRLKTENEKKSQFIFLKEELQYCFEKAENNWKYCKLFCLNDKIIILSTSDNKIIFQDFTLTTEILCRIGHERPWEFWLVNQKNVCFYFRSLEEKGELAKQIWNVISNFQGKPNNYYNQDQVQYQRFRQF